MYNAIYYYATSHKVPISAECRCDSSTVKDKQMPSHGVRGGPAGARRAAGRRILFIIYDDDERSLPRGSRRPAMANKLRDKAINYKDKNLAVPLDSNAASTRSF